MPCRRQMRLLISVQPEVAGVVEIDLVVPVLAADPAADRVVAVGRRGAGEKQSADLIDLADRIAKGSSDCVFCFPSHILCENVF